MIHHETKAMNRKHQSPVSALRRQSRTLTTLLCGAPLSLAVLLTPALTLMPEKAHASELQPEIDYAASRSNLLKLMRTITIEFSEQRLEDVIQFISEFTGAEIEPEWENDRAQVGLDKESLITLSVKNVTALVLLERVLEQAQDDFTENSWQMSKWGSIQIGPKERLNKYKRVQMYDINDLLMEVPDYDEVPDIDLQQVLQSNQGGGGQSPFRDDNQNDDLDRRTRDERAQEIVDLVIQLVETEQWTDQGGTGGSIRQWQGHIIVNAADYMHRGLDGYPWWPQRAQSARTMAGGRRYVAFNVDTGFSRIDGFGEEEVTAVVGGQLQRSGDGEGGG